VSFSRAIACFRGIADLEAATSEVAGERAEGREYRVARCMVLDARRSCQYWFRHRPGFSAEQHLYIQEARQAEARGRLWNLASALVGAVVGGLLAILGVLIALAFG
jgi:hypothetical protein